MNEQEINHQIAIQVNGWIHDEGIFYHDVSGFTCYLADYCNSIAHALDLAKTHNVGLKPTADGWIAYKLSDETVANTDPVAAKAICLCLLNTTEGV
ncbi:MAG: hypothetical protein HC764_23925 [Pleurocapsa sp. CRU_1_2]|nr:hypothetical protein [Pleurocapsa sp. CRU_1_2]